MIEPCKHGDIRPNNCALCRYERFGPDRDPRRPVRGSVPMPPWFRMALAEWRAGGPMAIPPDRLSAIERATDEENDRDRPYYG